MKRIITVLVLCSMLLAITGCSEINFVPVNDETLNDEQVSTVDPENELIVEDEQNANVESDRTSDQESNIISAEAVVSQGTTVTEDVIDEEAASDVDGDIVAAEESVSENVVTDAVNYTKPIKDVNTGGKYYGKYEEHIVTLPKLTLSTDNAKAFNDKIIYEQGEGYTKLQNGTEGASIYRVSYNFAIHNGIVGILVSNPKMQQESYINDWYHGYYYDLNNDCELTFEEYLGALGFSFASFTEEINKRNTNMTEWGAPVELNPNISEHFRIKNAILDVDTTIVSYPSTGMGGEELFVTTGIID